MKFPYITDYYPPAPSIEIRLGPPGGDLSLGPFAAFVDTGADISLIPISFIAPLQLAADNYGYVRSQWGERRQVSVYSLDIGVGLARLLAVDMAADAQSREIVLGRNILNKLILTLNGPKQFLELQT